MVEVGDRRQQSRVSASEPSEQLRVHLVALSHAGRNELHHARIGDEDFMAPGGQLLADPARVPAHLDRDARRRESLEMTGQGFGRGPKSTFRQTVAVRTEETAMTVAIPEVDADRDRAGRRDFCASFQVGDLR